MKYDIIIIGGGLGGLTAGAKLAREGKKVLLIEQHSVPGGCATTFKRGEYTLEVGLHEMDGPGPRDMKNRVFSELEVSGNVELVRIPEFYRFINGRYSFTMPHDPVKAAEGLSELFPFESEGIKAYFDQLLNSRKKSSEPFTDKSIGEFLDSIIKDDDLKLILLGNLGYFHDDPYTLSLAYFTMAEGSYFTNGASFIKGGSQKLSDHLAEYIRSHGGEVLLNHLAVKIITEGKRAICVVYRKKGSQVLTEAKADEIIANNSAPDVAEMLPPDIGGDFKKEISSLKAGASVLTVYFGFRSPLSELGHKYYSLFIYDESVKSQADILKNNRAGFDVRSFTFVDYGQIDSALAPEGKSAGAICCIDYLADWEGLGKKEYDAKKELVAQTFIGRLEKMIPGIKNLIEYYEVGTPKTVKRYTLNPGGAVYGFAQNPNRKVIEGVPQLENLHFASAWGKTGGGFSGAILGGYLCAYNILRKRS